MWQFKILLSNKVNDQMKAHSGFKHFQTGSSHLNTASPVQPCPPLLALLNQKAAELCQSPFHYPNVFRVNSPKSRDNSVFSWLFQGANTLKSKNSRHAEAQPLNHTKSELVFQSKALLQREGTQNMFEEGKSLISDLTFINEEIVYD